MADPEEEAIASAIKVFSEDYMDTYDESVRGNFAAAIRQTVATLSATASAAGVSRPDAETGRYTRALIIRDLMAASVPIAEWVGKELFASEKEHADGEPFQELLPARVTAVNVPKARQLASRPLPRAQRPADRRRLLRRVFPVFTIQATGTSTWIRTGVPFAVIADGHRRWVHAKSDADVALTEHRWC